jgi:hypothetical protein
VVAALHDPELPGLEACVPARSDKGAVVSESAAQIRNAPRLPGMAALREVTETIRCDDVIRVERLSCGHTKTTLTASHRPAKRWRCLKCDEERLSRV